MIARVAPEARRAALPPPPPPLSFLPTPVGAFFSTVVHPSSTMIAVSRSRLNPARAEQEARRALAPAAREEPSPPFRSISVGDADGVFSRARTTTTSACARTRGVVDRTARARRMRIDRVATRLFVPPTCCQRRDHDEAA
eukprot:31529-Pelagococcus_subviridis.AAC.14